MTFSDFHGPNAAYLLDLYERFQADPLSVDEETRTWFATWTPPGLTAAEPAPGAPPVAVSKITAAAALAHAIRAHGHVAAHLDPLAQPMPGDPALDPATHGLTPDDLAALPAEVVGGPLAQHAPHALAALDALRRVYMRTTGYDYEHVRSPAERAWLREMAESERFQPPNLAFDAHAVLAQLTRVEGFERFLHRVFVGQTRFSIEGVDMLVPLLEALIGTAAQSGQRTVLMGMAHRGRLNVMAHVLGKPYARILAEFHDPARRPHRSHAEGYEEGWTGDVKYHLGVSRRVGEGALVEMTIQLAPNPSHLEAINPIVAGRARAAGERTSLTHSGAPAFDENRSLPVLIHGDAAFPGQGVVAETLNLSQLAGYRTGGTIHIITNNQIGFTTISSEDRSTLYASDLAKGFKIPVVHVNADDPIACISAALLAHAYRALFHKDFMIDLIGYRRWGHNEGDEPTFTQPLMYERIAHHPSVREQWARTLIERGVVTPAQVEALQQETAHELQTALEEARQPAAEAPASAPAPAPAHSGTPDPFTTAVSAEHLTALNTALLEVPTGFTLNPKLLRAIERRRQALAPDGTIEWAHAETLAFATLLTEGVPIRITGQDSERGTFTQRHLVFHDAKTGTRYTPLQAIPGARAAFAVHNSPLSESAVLGFEYGYSVELPGVLVLWEAQYGDFVNSAQVMLDQFVTSARAKWGERPGLALLLPHGYEGQGPEHSSARLERFLQMAADDNLRIAYCTTAAQYFHLLRYHARWLARDPRPLVVMTPKRLLRHPLAASPLNDFTTGGFQALLCDPVADPSAVRRLVLCSGKVYVDAVASALHNTRTEIAFARVEELYPFPAAQITALCARYPALAEIVWLQEEPQNMGAWTFVAPRLRALLPSGVTLRYAGRPDRASPAEGSAEWHEREQARIVAEVYADWPPAA